MRANGQIIILNGAPRSGKSSLAREIISTFEGQWINLGVDQKMRDETPRDMWPGIGLRPGENRPDLEDFIVWSYQALYTSIAHHSRVGIGVAVDVGHHDCYSRPLAILPDCMRLVAVLPVMVVGVRCELDEILKRRVASGEDYLSEIQIDNDLSTVHLWQEAVHDPGIYDLEVDTTHHSANECAKQIRKFLNNGRNCHAARTLAGLNRA